MSETLQQRCLAAGASILVASVDPKGAPACCRGVAVTTDDDLATLTVYVPVATSREMIANVATTRRIAVSMTDVPTHGSIQVKGTTLNLRLAGEEERRLVEERLLAFADVLSEVGLPRKITRSISHWPAFAIEFKVEQLYDQTPGPRAGGLLT